MNHSKFRQLPFAHQTRRKYRFTTEEFVKIASGRSVFVFKRRLADSVMNRIAQYITNACHDMVSPYKFFMIITELAKAAFPFIFLIEMEGITSSEGNYEIRIRRCQYCNVYVVGH